MSWESWIQDVAGSVINKAADAKYTQPYNIEAMRLQTLGELGMYQEGQSGVVQSASTGGLLGMSQGQTVLLIGGALLAFFMLKD